MGVAPLKCIPLPRGRRAVERVLPVVLAHTNRTVLVRQERECRDEVSAAAVERPEGSKSELPILTLGNCRDKLLFALYGDDRSSKINGPNLQPPGVAADVK